MDIFLYFIALVKLINYFTQYIFHLFIGKKYKSIKGWTALITGGGKGIGKNIAMRLASYGCNIAIVDIDLESAQEVVNELKTFGTKAAAFKADVSKLKDIEELKVNVEVELGPIDLLVNNAGILMARHVTEESPERLKLMVDTNLMSSVWTTRVFLPGMIERKRGHIVAICSTSALAAIPDGLVYSATKFGIRGFMESLALQLHQSGHGDYIKLTTACPYFVNTQPVIYNIVNKGLNLFKMLFTVEECGQFVLEAIVRDEDVATLPGWYYYAFYLISPPIFIKKLLIGLIMKKDFNPHVDEMNNIVETGQNGDLKRNQNKFNIPPKY